MRRHVLELAKCDPDDARPLVASGHQPGLPHPGILFKHAVLEQLSSRAVALNIVVESDTVEVLAARVPRRRSESITIEEVVLARTEKRVVLGCAPKPERRPFEGQISEVRRAAATLNNDEVLHAVDHFAAIHREEYARHESLAPMLTAYRRRYFPTPHVREVFLSSLCDTDEFRAFAAGLIEDADRFCTAHNEALAAYRLAHHIRTRVNPFPDLRREGDVVETPLWHIGEDGRRAAVYVAFGADENTLLAHTTPLGSFATRAQLDRLLSQMQLRPRAVTLTLLLRLCVVDLFIHGVGGGNYDAVTDAIMRDYLGIEPPVYGVASLTVRLPLTFDDGLEARARELAYRARRMTWNPDEFVPAAHPLREEKRAVLAGAGARLTRQEHERIESVRVHLHEEIAGTRESNDREREALGHALANQRLLAARDFPYFLYPLPLLQAATQAADTTIA